MEECRDIEGYEGLYQISNQGRVKSLKYGKEKILKAAKNSSGYLYVGLWKDGKQTNQLIHRLIAQTFIPNPNNLPEVNHKDEDKSNNSIENLEWCDRSYNINYSLNKRVDQIDSATGEVVRQWESTAECGRNGYNQGGVSECCNGLRKTHKGYIWKYTPM